MKRIIISLSFILTSSIMSACTCTFTYIFCQHADTSDYIALVELIAYEVDSGPDITAGYFKLIENLNKEIPDTLNVLGQDGLNCNLDFDGFNIGDTLVINFSKYSFPFINAQNLREYFWGIDGCNRNYIHYSAGVLAGNITELDQEMDYLDFKESVFDCLDFSLSSEDDFIASDVSIYPNPSADRFYLNLGGTKAKDISVYNLSGQYIRTNLQENKQGVELDLTGEASGVYIVNIHTTKGIIRKKIMKL